MWSWSIHGSILFACVFLHFVEGYEVITENGCSKVVRREHQTILDGKIDEVSNVRYQVCYETLFRTYFCPGDTICCTPGSIDSKCCPEDHPLCVGEGCCPIGYPKICGEYCCEENSYCCGENCCKDERSCCGKDRCCTDNNPCCTNGEEKTCCNKDTEACCGEGYGCVEPCESPFDAIGCEPFPTKVRFDASRVADSFTINFKTLFRVLRIDEIPAQLIAKNPYAKKTVISHVNCGSRPKYGSQYISTTSSLEVAQLWVKRGKAKGIEGLRIAEIDVTKLPSGTKIFDLTTEENRQFYLKNAVCKNFAKASLEVLLESDKTIPSKVIEEGSHDVTPRNLEL